MTDLDDDQVRIEALFASYLQRSQRPSAELIRETVVATVRRLGENGCMELVAQEFGEHPDSAVGRMIWARTAVQRAFDPALGQPGSGQPGLGQPGRGQPGRGQPGLGHLGLG